MASLERNSHVDPPIQPPDTDRVGWAVELIHSVCDPVVAAHCERSFQFAGLIARLEGLQPDLEVLFLGTVLHDLGLAPRLQGPDRFEMRGANHVREVLLGTGMDPVRVGNVWDVIALHASSAIAAHKSLETSLANRGISVDVRGAGIERLSPVDVERVLACFPRRGFTETFSRILIAEVHANPASARLSWLESIAARSIPGYQPTDFLAALESSTAAFPPDPIPQFPA
jgi:hypothetical protein